MMLECDISHTFQDMSPYRYTNFSLSHLFAFLAHIHLSSQTCSQHQTELEQLSGREELHNRTNPRLLKQTPIRYGVGQTNIQQAI